MSKPLKVNLLHALADFLDAYPHSPPEVALTEGISNSMDAGASKIQIHLDKEKSEFSLLDNGGGMSKEDFEHYHTVALSSKKKGTGIGFAGVGSKIYLAAGPEAMITTETLGPDGPLASVIRRVPTNEGYDDLVYDEVKSTLKSRGTLYTVRMSSQHFKEMEENAQSWITKWFNEILTTGSREILLEGKRVRGWKPKTVFEESKKFRVKGVDFQVDIFNTKEKLQVEMLGLNVIVYGKYVKKYDFPWQYQLKNEVRETIFATLNADPLSEFLALNKLEFKGSHLVHSVIEKANAEVYDVLNKKGLIVPLEGEQPAEVVTNALTNSFTNLLLSPAFRKFNPWIRAREADAFASNPIGAVLGSKMDAESLETEAEDVSGGRREKAPRTSTPEEERKKMMKTIGIAFADLPDNPREGWVDSGQRAIIVNIGHPMHRKLIEQKDVSAINLNILRVLVTAVLGYKKEELPDLTPESLLKTQSEMIAAAWVNL